jgi:DNA-binding FadR family transcriptional regulator
MPRIEPVARRSLSDAVFAQLRDRIVAGELAAGEPLPGERDLCTALGVNRGALREALKRLDQARLVAVRHGGATEVRDFREHAGLDLLPELLVNERGTFDPEVVSAVIEMRSALAPDVARLAAGRAGPELAVALDAIVSQMEEVQGDAAALQRLALDFWAELVRACGNLAYRLAFNSLRDCYARAMGLLTEVMRDEFADVKRYTAIARAVAAGEAEHAEHEARLLVRRGEGRVKAALAETAS